MSAESKMLLKKKEEAVGIKTISNGVFLPVNYLRIGLPDQLWNPNHKVLLVIKLRISSTKKCGSTYTSRGLQTSTYLPKRAPKSKNIASTPRPNVSDIIAKYEVISRFKEG